MGIRGKWGGCALSQVLDASVHVAHFLYTHGAGLKICHVSQGLSPVTILQADGITQRHHKAFQNPTQHMPLSTVHVQLLDKLTREGGPQNVHRAAELTVC